MKTFFWTAIFTIIGCWQMLAGDLLWEKAAGHQLESVSVIHLSNSITNVTYPSADYLKQHYTHLFVERFSKEQDSFYKSLKNLLSSSQPVGPIKPAETGEFRWC